MLLYFLPRESRNVIASNNFTPIVGRKIPCGFNVRDGWILQCAMFREPIAQHCGTKQKAPSLRQGLMLKRQGSAYRLTWTLVPPAKGPAPWAPSPLETTLTQSASLPL
jgi:hypothetical protein